MRGRCPLQPSQEKTGLSHAAGGQVGGQRLGCGVISMGGFGDLDKSSFG